MESSMTLAQSIADIQARAESIRGRLLLGVEGMERRTAERLGRELERLGAELVRLRAKELRAKEATKGSGR